MSTGTKERHPYHPLCECERCRAEFKFRRRNGLPDPPVKR